MYTPDKWVIVKIDLEKESFYKVLGGWSGGYLEGQSWRMNSGIAKISQEGDYLLIHGYSGSIYKCHKNAYGTNMIMAGVLSQMEQNKKSKVTLIDEKAVPQLELYEKSEN